MNSVHIFWVAGAGFLGFLTSAIFGGVLRLQRRWFLLPFTLAIGAFLAAYVVVNELDVINLMTRNLVWGLIGGALAAGVLVKNVLSQPASRQGTVLDLLWAGVIYGTIDGLLLTVMPIVAMWQAFGIPRSGLSQVWIGALAMLGSIYITFTYHFGYPEFRGPGMMKAILGNAIITLTVLLTGSPLAAVLSHAAMHVVAVLHGPETTVQLPPHYVRHDLRDVQAGPA
jgi:hypothetical protein